MVLWAVVNLFNIKPLSVAERSKDAFKFGFCVPKPMVPVAAINNELLGAPGLILKGNKLPFVTSLTKKFVSFPATSHVWAVQPLAPFCSKRKVGESPSVTCNSTTGVSVPKPTFPLFPTYKALAPAPANILNGIFKAVASVTPK